jgi:hypothetical protein
MFRRKHVPEGVSNFLQAAQVAPEHRHLLGSGAQGQGVVTRHDLIASTQFGDESWYSVHVRFRFPDGTETEISQGCRHDKVGTLAVGDKVPVRFDPQDHAKVVLDLPALEVRHQQKAAAAQAAWQRIEDEKVAKAQAEIDGRVWIPAGKSEQQGDLVIHRTDTRPGLAWTPIGGQLLPVEASVSPGSGALTFDGALADVLEPPARAALSHLSAQAAELMPWLDRDWFARHDLRVFQPYGGRPPGDLVKDAPSAGVAMVAALVSLLGGHLVLNDVALTGGIAETGDLLPVHDLAKKAKAAQRMYTKQLIVPAANQQSGPDQQAGLQLVFAATVSEALSAALGRHRLKGYDPPA